LTALDSFVVSGQIPDDTLEEIGLAVAAVIEYPS
jgi:hypothetical protein